MSVVVRMEMPENCFKCPLHEFGGVCLLKVEHTAEEWLNIDKRRPLNCPIICQLPEGHGRLVDASSKIMVPMDPDGEPREMTIDSLLDYVTPFIESVVPAERSET